LTQLRLSAAIGLAMLGLGAAAARADCPDSNTEFDDFYCSAKLYVAADDDLNAIYQALTPKLDTDAKSALKTSQLAWMKKRNEECGRSDSDGYYVDLSCAVDFTRTRTQFLRDRAAECDAGKCDLGKMTAVE
jgi:uncharacterized protein YecT (DUF1311 family)